MVDKAPLDPEFEGLLNYIQESRCLDFRGYKRTSLRRRISLRMEALGAENFAAYQAHLEVHPGEFEALLNTVLINVTSFFRDEEAWRALKEQVIPAIIASAGEAKPIRVWSIGCASGEEPYSVAMLFADQMGNADFCRRVKIYATDLDEDALKSARLATYAPRSVENVPPEMLEKYFERTNNHYVFHRDLRKCVIFGRHNVVHDAPIGRIDLLVCRSLLIYLESETQSQVLPRLHYALAQDGYLFLGKAETQLARSALFRPVEMKHRIFAKLPLEWRRPLNGAFTSAHRPHMEAPHLADAKLLEHVLNEATAAYLVIDDEGVVVFANAAARQLLGVSEIDIGRPFQDLPISYRPIELRGPLDDVFNQRRGSQLEDQEYRLTQSEVIRLTIDLRPLYRPDGTVYAALLAFSDTTRLNNLQRELEHAQENLENSIEELQSANEELETTNEELQSTNEELETTNEELQSTNEELETLNEEARSSNEEMEAVNEELRIHAEQAASYRLYLESVLRAMNGGIIVIDTSHKIMSWNRWSELTWGLQYPDVVGSDFDALDIGMPLHQLQDGITAVQSGRSEQVDQTLEGLDRRGRPITCRVRISGLLDDKGGNSGVVMVFQDITRQQKHEDDISYLGRIMDRALNEVYFLDPTTLRFVMTNEGAKVKLGHSDEELKTMTLADVVSGISTGDIKALLAPLLAGVEQEIVFETIMRRANGREQPAELCVQYLGDESPPILVMVVHDTSERRQLRKAG